jgi:hypothetical protein
MEIIKTQCMIAANSPPHTSVLCLEEALFSV